MKKVYFILFLIFLICDFAYADRDIVNLKMNPTANKGKIDKAYKIVKAGFYQSFLNRYLEVIGMDSNWKKGKAAGKFQTQIIYKDNIFKTKSEEKLIKLINKAK